MAMTDTYSDDLATSGGMISSADVNGTTVFGSDGTEVGHIDHLMLDKQSGRVAYAVMNFGGFLGMGEEEHPVPWDQLTYDTSRGGYVTAITQEQLQAAPDRTDDWRNDDRYRDDVFRHYNSAPYWI